MTPLRAARPEPDPGLLRELLRTGRLRHAPAIGAAIAPGEPSAAPDLVPPAGARPLSCGVAALDAALGGGFARGAVHEVVAPPSAGGTALLCAALALATRAGELCALVDLDDAFDPRGAQAAGADLRRLLWVAPRSLAQGLRAAELLLEARFSLVALDLGAAGGRPERARRAGDRPADRTGVVELVRFAPRKRERVGDAPWARLSRCAEKHQGALLVLSREPQAGSFASSTLELVREGARFSGRPDSPGRLFLGAAAVGAVSRARRRAPSGPVRVGLPWSEGAAWADDR